MFIKPGGSEPGPDGEGKWRLDGPIPGDGARRGGVARPNPESVSKWGIVSLLLTYHESVMMNIIEIMVRYYVRQLKYFDRKKLQYMTCDS